MAVASAKLKETYDAAPWQHSRNEERETWLLVRVMARIDNPDKVKNAINAAQREQARLAKIFNDQADEIRALKMPKPAPDWSGGSAGEMLTAIRRKVATSTN